MLSNVLKILVKTLLPETMEDKSLRSRDPIQLLVSVHQRLVQLAAQIEAHAGSAPYPYVADRLRQIAREKQDAADELKEWLQRRGEPLGAVSISQPPGKNHWERVMRDLKDQTEFQDLLSLNESRISAVSPELAEFLRQLKIGQAAHRKALMKLVAVADPQATQT